MSDKLLTAAQLQLADRLARENHQRWVQQKQIAGWSYGRHYDEAKQLHPELCPYVALPETRQQDKRLAAQITIEILSDWGYSLNADCDRNNAPDLNLGEDIQLILEQLQTSSQADLSSLLTLQRETIRLQPHTPEIYQVLGESILRSGEPLVAYDILAEGLKRWPQDLRLQQLLALALARSGSSITANTLLQHLVQTSEPDEETLGLLARTHKDLWIQAADSAISQQHLRLAAERYQQAYQLNNSVWTGINAATMAMLQGNTEQARTLANKVREQCLAQLDTQTDNNNPYWLLATLGEAALILGQWTAAEDFYGQAVQLGQGRFGDLASSRRNAQLLVRHLEGDLRKVNQWFQIPRVVVFCGHAIDRPMRPTPRFPPQLEPAVYRAICDRLQSLNARLGYASAACGSDILFLEALLQLQGELHIILPYNQEQFIQDSVDIIPGENWLQRFKHVMDRATETIIASKQKPPIATDVAYEYSHRLLHGLANIRAEQLDTDLIPLAVWNQKPGDGPGGTASAVSYWQQWTETVEILDLETILNHTQLPLLLNNKPSNPSIDAVPHSRESRTALGVERQIRAILFADVVHFSNLTEEQFIPFLEHFWGAIATLANQPSYDVLMKNTWGDAIYFVFATVQHAGRFALDLCDLVQEIDWSSKGLPTDINLRIALHAGPVCRNIDPITGRATYSGPHVNHAARIEPITPPGKVYASQAFAAIASSEKVKHFTCDYVGQTPYAKRYGTFPTYHVHRCFT